jgi:uncharacterized tellurite resistance protein B-like protein
MGLETLRAFFAPRLEDTGDTGLLDPVTVAACALLLEIAYADNVFLPEERERIARHIREERGVDEQQLREVFRAAEQERQASVDFYQFTRLLDENLSREERRRLVETIWEVVYADGDLSSAEGHLARRVGELLGFQHPEVQQIKEAVAARRGVSS